MPRPLKPASPFRYFNSSPEIIRLVVMMYVRLAPEEFGEFQRQRFLDDDEGVAIMMGKGNNAASKGQLGDPEGRPTNREVLNKFLLGQRQCREIAQGICR